jgi:hypothetical protein
MRCAAKRDSAHVRRVLTAKSLTTTDTKVHKEIHFIGSFVSFVIPAPLLLRWRPELGIARRELFRYV